ncbi:Serine carboxypeptidase [Penicillium ucsense]|uniref:Serine carboxypeptidase n=1 Tax=Penicillium ucsense TaxID=2839758 RepID=A0A8J8WAA2_9EURO|nr:Serine carboxypeptidase [Penicillium ucsense]KAF7738931.1 Serine carboxypeptidase [Penicillium ucsense]
MHFSIRLALPVLCASAAQAAIAPKPVPPPAVDTSQAIQGAATFEQLIDHKNPGLGTFSQRYWWSSEWWAGEGSPVILFTPGESAADEYTGYLTNRTLTGRYAQEVKGAVVMIEHRYWGESSPYAELTTENLQALTLENSIADLNYFARNVELPFDTNGSSNAQNAPWVMSGGSYSGALAAWTESTAPGTFWAYHASSAPVEAIYDYWQYFSPVQQGMPQNCSRDVSRVVDHIDKINKSGNEKKMQELKDMFGLGDIEHFDDFASALENGPWLWQSNTFYTGYSGFFQFCDYVENVDAGHGKIPGHDGVGTKKALEGYAKWFKSVYLPGACANYGYWSDPMSTDCFNTYNASSPIFTDVTLKNTVDRQWQWFLCNEPFFYWQDGAPSHVQSLVSRSVDAKYWQRQCSLYFPEVNGFTFASAKGKDAEDVNQKTKGWDLTDTTRLIWANGEFDPWRTSGMSSEYRPGGPLKSRPSAPLNIIPGGFHCSDLILKNGAVNAGVQKVIDAEVAQIKTWVAEYYKK